MNKELIAKKINEYEMLAYNEIISEINKTIKEAKESNLNPLDTYRLIQSKLESLEEELVSIFPISKQFPLSEDILEKIDGYIDPYANEAMKFAKSKVYKQVDDLDNSDLIDLYDDLKKR